MVLSDFQEEWLSFMETTDLPQNQGSLEHIDGGRYCCLGLGCLLAEKRGIKVDRMHHGGFLFGGGLEQQPDVQKALGLRGFAGSTASALSSGRFGFTDNLGIARLNDTGHTFREIAAIIRANPEEYFITGEEK